MPLESTNHVRRTRRKCTRFLYHGSLTRLINLVAHTCNASKGALGLSAANTARARFANFPRVYLRLDLLSRNLSGSKSRFRAIALEFNSRLINDFRIIYKN